nr:MAG TPA: hypothetical protein [Caudoviricetes sp.]DAU24728.1 MAG TPA: hypothetical protein [Caudoviricetes sp.]
MRLSFGEHAEVLEASRLRPAPPRPAVCREAQINSLRPYRSAH